MPWRLEPQPSAKRWRAIGLTAYLTLLTIYAGSGAYIDHTAAGRRLYWLLGGAALLAGIAALTGRLRGWQNHRTLLVRWPLAH